MTWRAWTVLAVGVVIGGAALAVGAASIGPQPREHDPLLAAAPDDAGASLLQESMQAERRGELEAAAVAAERAVSAGAGRDARLQAAKVAILRQRYDEAEAWLTPLLQANPQDVPARYDLALAAQHLGDAAAARDGYTAVLQIEPTHADARFNLILTLVDLGQRSAAREELARFRQLHPRDARGPALAQRLEAPP